MSPLPEHGRNVHIIANVITTILDYLEQEYEAFTPITMKLPQRSGIEPDYCFYIDNWQAVSGQKRINWSVDPAPDLIIEIDITSYTDVNDYLAYKVPEVWLFKSDHTLTFQTTKKRSPSLADASPLHFIIKLRDLASSPQVLLAIALRHCK